MVADLILEANGKTKRDLIVEYIIRHDGCTQTAIIDYMTQAKHSEEKSLIKAASETTRKILRELAAETDDKGNRILNITKDPKNSQIHHYHFHNKFSLVYKELDKIENVIVMWEYPIHRINSDYKKFPPGSPDIAPGFYVKEKFAVVYIKAIRAMLYELLDQLAILKLSEENAQIIFKRIMRLIEKLIAQTTDKPNPKDTLIVCKKESLSVKKALADNALASYYFKPKMYDNLIQLIEEFDKQFLS